MINKVVVFDMDETLGCFQQLSVFYDALCKYFKGSSKILTQNEFNKLLDLYPEYLRPLIMDICKYIYNKKKKGDYKKVCIYTNNQGPKSWTTQISKYFDYKLKISDSLFDKCICAFMVEEKRIELFRTSHEKNYDDLVKCARLPKNTQVCFIDDVHHEQMIHENVYYIYIKPYHYYFSNSEIIDRYLKNPIFPVKDEEHFKKFMKSYISQYYFKKKTKQEHELDEVVTKQIYNCLKEF